MSANALTQAQAHARKADLLGKVAQGFVKLLFTRYLFGNIELPADLAGCVKQRDVQPAPRCRGGKRQPGRARAHHRNAFAHQCRGFDHQGFMAGARVD